MATKKETKPTFTGRRKRREWQDPADATTFEKSKTDTRFYTPTEEIVRNQMYGALAGQNEEFYDFKDGKDDGKALPPHRWEGIDRAEMSQKQQELEAEIAKDKEETEAMKAELAEKQAEIEKLQAQIGTTTNKMDVDKGEM